MDDIEVVTARDEVDSERAEGDRFDHDKTAAEIVLLSEERTDTPTAEGKTSNYAPFLLSTNVQ